MRKATHISAKRMPIALVLSTGAPVASARSPGLTT
jgi:hypothetical protein